MIMLVPFGAYLLLGCSLGSFFSIGNIGINQRCLVHQQTIIQFDQGWPATDDLWPTETDSYLSYFSRSRTSI